MILQLTALKQCVNVGYGFHSALERWWGLESRRSFQPNFKSVSWLNSGEKVYSYVQMVDQNIEKLPYFDQNVDKVENSQKFLHKGEIVATRVTQ